ncbi:MAG: hypothetical protein PHU85_17980, partial [Phycisphaerae bacterium]|nr:hypothetical protein [Phycisphaerae bacterium]
MKNIYRTAILAVMGTAWITAAPAADESSPPAASQPAAAWDRDRDPIHVQVAESPDALRQFRRAHQLAKSQTWNEAAIAFHELQAANPDQLMHLGGGQFVAVGEAVSRELDLWPAEGLAAYRRQYDRFATTSYDEAAKLRDPGKMAAVARKYWAATLGPRAADEAAELALESGRPLTAVDLWGRLARRAEATKQDGPARAALLAKLAVALAQADQPERAERICRQLAKDFADVANPFTGGGTLAAWAKANIARPDAPTQNAEAYPIFGGTISRANAADAAGELGAEAWSFDKHAPPPFKPVASRPAAWDRDPKRPPASQPASERPIFVPTLACGT